MGVEYLKCKLCKKIRHEENFRRCEGCGRAYCCVELDTPDFTFILCDGAGGFCNYYGHGENGENVEGTSPCDRYLIATCPYDKEAR